MTTSIIEDNATVLFQGDSITDASRNREVGENLGDGYAMIAAALFSAKYPEKNVRFLNRGVSGNTVKNLKERWQEDCLDLKPTWVSIMIGINDTGQTMNKTNHVSLEAYEADLRTILDQVKEKLNARLILIEPFLLPVHANYSDWRVNLDPRIEVVHRLAEEYQAILVPIDQLFAQRADQQPHDKFWTNEGVHPTPAGYALIAEAWLSAVNGTMPTPDA